MPAYVIFTEGQQFACEYPDWDITQLDRHLRAEDGRLPVISAQRVREDGTMCQQVNRIVVRSGYTIVQVTE